MTEHRYGTVSVELSNPEKFLFSADRIRKEDLLTYYERIAQLILPHLQGRPLVLQRFPDGIGDGGFYQKQVSAHAPNWISTVEVELKTKPGSQRLVVCDDMPTLAHLVNQAAITLHPWLSRVVRIHHPDLMVLDLDPPDDADFESVRWAALRTRELLEELGVPSFPKLTGSRGIHVVVRLDGGDDFDVVRAFAREAMDLLARRYPDELTTEQRKAKRGNRLYLDTGRNAYGQTAVAPWSVRALPHAPIAAPVAWKSLERRGLGAQSYTIANVFRRIAQRSDPWPGYRDSSVSLARARRRLERLSRDER